MNRLKNLLKSVFVPMEGNGYLPRALQPRPLFWYGAGILVLKIAIISLILIFPSTNLFSAISSQRLLTLINAARQERNLSPLTPNNKLTAAAELKTADMINKNYFEHTSPLGITPWYWFGLAGYNFAWAGENLAMDFFETDKVFQAWMDSASHRDNILNPNFKEIGIAVKEGEIQRRQTTLAVLTFGSQQAAAPKSPAAAAPPKKPAPIATPTPEPAKKISAPAPPSAPPVQPQLPLKTAQGTLTPSPEISSWPPATPSAISGIERVPRVLGVFTSRLDEMVKSLYLYFILFLIAALAINIFVKIRIQYWGTIFTTTSLIILSVLLIFV